MLKPYCPHKLILPKPFLGMALIVGGMAFVVYLRTLAPTITWQNSGADSGDFATAVAVGGVPHPPGYPTYLAIAEIFKYLPAGDIAYRLNLLSAVSAAGTVLVIGLIIYSTLSNSFVDKSDDTSFDRLLAICCAAIASLALAFAAPFWAQAVIAEVYTLHTLFAAVLILVALRSAHSQSNRGIALVAFLLGLGLGNHLSLLLLLPLLGAILWHRWTLRQLVAAVGALGLGLSVYLLIPLRAASMPAVNWGMATTWPDFWWLVSAAQYRQFLFGLPHELIPVRLVSLLRLVSEAFFWWGLPVGLLGLQTLWRYHRAFAVGSALSFGLICTYALMYNTGDSHVYLLTALVLFAVWIGWGLFDLGGLMKQSSLFSQRGYLLPLIMILLPLLSLSLNFSQHDLSQDMEAYRYARQSLELVDSDAIIITDDDARTFALWYLRYGQQVRPDVAIVNTNLLYYDWYRVLLEQTHPHLRLYSYTRRPLLDAAKFIRFNLPNTPIYLATVEPPTLSEYHLERRGHLQQVASLPVK